MDIDGRGGGEPNAARQRRPGLAGPGRHNLGEFTALPDDRYRHQVSMTDAS